MVVKVLLPLTKVVVVGVTLLTVVVVAEQGTSWSVFVTVQEEMVFPSQAQGITVETHAQVL